MLDWYSEAPQGNTNIYHSRTPCSLCCGCSLTPHYPPSPHPPQAFLYVTNACVSIFGFAICVASGTALAVPNVLTSDELDLTSALRYTVVVGVFLLLMGLWGTCCRLLFFAPRTAYSY